MQTRSIETVQSSTKGSSGIVYLCTGSYSEMLRNSLKSLKLTNPEISLHILSDRPVGFPFTWIPNWTGKASRRIKTRLSDYSPFDVSLFVDTDTVFGKTIDIENLLGDADIAMGLDSCRNLGKGCSTFLKFPGFTTAEEVDETLRLCGQSFPFFNSGVIAWRNTDAVRRLFEVWHSEWLKYRRVDQLALARAVKKTGMKIKTLDQTYNYPVVSTAFKRDKAIYHLIYKKEIAKKTGLWDPQFDDPLGKSMMEAIRSGPRAENQYLHIGQRIYNAPKATTLVICPDHDEAFWRYCTHGNVSFVRDAAASDGQSINDAFPCEFPSRVGTWASSVEVPRGIDRPYDFVVISGPRGFNASCPGRELPIAWASQLATKEVFVFDYNRSWERTVCERYFGDPSSVLEPIGKGNAWLATFKISPGKSQPD